ncbi:histidine phosphatase family protein [Neolewinella aurantiaca]|uniref:Histidine phosphatase family protein n=1 Tax=Neolewinella aurantiaca TaxID=2602767 RepID=A0A5C7FR66_9BACT|nr:phosphoglycerate mutase family protein [Neolewinella aurantiaca]TXF88578.1 histidine phosphatase family protein [Neolewinella aurantiaca]
MLQRLTLLLLTVTFLFLSSCTSARKAAQEQFGDEKVTTFYLVRHAEKDFGDDPILTPQGTERAERLKEIMKNVDLAAVYSTDTKRTQLTAKPTADDHGLKIVSYRPTLLKELSEKLRSLYRGKVVLIVGHSNTTPAMTNYLTDSNVHPRFSELDYTNFYLVTLPRIGAPDVQKLRY